MLVQFEESQLEAQQQEHMDQKQIRHIVGDNDIRHDVNDKIDLVAVVEVAHQSE